ncbi:MAG: hybrid sensor histidine kinase/response regulator [Oscillatoria princeps RMCB-10]|jgi:signal transduction histidine kinase|nr:hybrid sensor histidine kinase/response regulator [Oscillatoria princeps RMCB-10]
MNSEPDKTSKENILVVDDTPDNVRLLTAMLNEQGYKVRKALNGPMAITACQMVLPDLILLDINMPQMNGYEVCHKLKADEKTREVPVIFISALDDVLDKVKAFDAGGADYITKPFQRGEVLSRIESQLKLRSLQLTLHRKNDSLERALAELKAAQVQLIHNEKMAALGQLVAGIAHEINNPINFIYGNLEHATQYVQDLVSILELYQEEYPNIAPIIQDKINELDLNFLREDAPNVMGAMRRGAERIRQLVVSLRNFSRLDEAEMKPVDIHEGTDSTLLMLQHRLAETETRPAITVIKEYGKLPPITCYASQLNQVFMHVLNNAIDALEDGRGAPGTGHGKEEAPRPTIWIRTELTANNTVLIRIADNGPGISEPALSRLFDPFFTTKKVGSGAGLGLSISYQIVVQQHKGQLTCSSSPGQGAEFAIEIPVRQNR